MCNMYFSSPLFIDLSFIILCNTVGMKLYKICRAEGTCNLELKYIKHDNEKVIYSEC